MPPSPPFAEALRSGPVLVAGAAIGTRLMARGLDLARDDPALWNRSHPAEVLDLHRRDVEAGAVALLANTFGASRDWLGRHGRSEDAGETIRIAIALAREAVGPSGFVIGSVGPGASLSDPGGSGYADVADGLSNSGADAILLETHDFDQADRALASLRGRVALPILVSLYRWPESIADAARRLVDRGASAVGANCGTGPAPVIAAIEALSGRVDVPLIAFPSGGAPGVEAAPPVAFSGIADRLAVAGARLIGGCCGTTEAHVAAIREGLGARWLADRGSPVRPGRA